MSDVIFDCVWFIFNAAALAGTVKDSGSGVLLTAGWGGLTAISGLLAVNAIVRLAVAP